MGFRDDPTLRRRNTGGAKSSDVATFPGGPACASESSEEDPTENDSEDDEQTEHLESGDVAEDELFAKLEAMPEYLPKPSPSWGMQLEKLGELLKRRHGDILQLLWDERKGRVIHSTATFQGGQHILSDRALLLRYEPQDTECQPLWSELERVCSEQRLPLSPIWYLAALDATVTVGALEEAMASLAAAAPLAAQGAVKADIQELEVEAPEQEAMLARVGRPPEEEGHQEPRLSRTLTQALLIACLQPLTPVASSRLSLLYRDAQFRKPSAAVLAVLSGLDLLDCFDPVMVEERLEALRQNCFDCVSPDGRPGLGVWFTASFLSHSCIPNAMWLADSQGAFRLVARRYISPGDEITLSYLDDEGLAQHASVRRRLLAASKGFICMCERCRGKDAVQPRSCFICGQILHIGPSSNQALPRRNSCQGLLARLAANAYFASHVLVCMFTAYKQG